MPDQPTSRLSTEAIQAASAAVRRELGISDEMYVAARAFVAARGYWAARLAEEDRNV